MKSHYRKDANAPASAENEVFRTFAEAHENAKKGTGGLFAGQTVPLRI
jgi:hypothetical protein